MTIKVLAVCETGFNNATHRDVLEFDDGTAEEQIEEEVRDWAFNYIEISWAYAEGNDNDNFNY